VRNAIEDDQHITIQEISDSYCISVGTVYIIIHDELTTKKVCAKWVPHLLTEAQTKERMRCSAQLLAMFEPHGPKRLTDVITGDGTFISFYGMPSKRANMAWINEAGDRPVVLRPGFSCKKTFYHIFQLHWTVGC